MNILFVCVVFAFSSASVSETITPTTGEKPTAKESSPVIIDNGGLIPPSPSTPVTATNVTVSKNPSPEVVAKGLPLLPGPQIISEKDDVELNKKVQDGTENSKSDDAEIDEEAGDDDDDDEEDDDIVDDDGKTELKSSDRGMMTGNEQWEKYESEKGKPGDEDDKEKSDYKVKDDDSKGSDVFQPGSEMEATFPEFRGSNSLARTTTMEPLETTDFDMFEYEDSKNSDEVIGFEEEDDDKDDDDEDSNIDMHELQNQELLPVGDQDVTDNPIGDFEENGAYNFDDDDDFEVDDGELSKHKSDTKEFGKQEKSGHGASVEVIKESSTNFKFSVGLFIIVVVTVIALFIYWNWNTVERFILLRRLTPGRRRARGADEEKLLGPETA
ncbi:protein PFC0760c-like isoform X2 [Dreissena polymorpha]|uniref:protein PFC0760c-like isoform X2 n=1 Tax=Dreissena polymorpha TaxID=45954 RepID=UPI00226517EB|nr:protein PFC0760c-like isoform X2 [Dreissena polymorpha]